MEYIVGREEGQVTSTEQVICLPDFWEPPQQLVPFMKHSHEILKPHTLCPFQEVYTPAPSPSAFWSPMLLSGPFWILEHLANLLAMNQGKIHTCICLDVHAKWIARCLLGCFPSYCLSETFLIIELWCFSHPLPADTSILCRIISKSNLHFFFLNQLVLGNSPCHMCELKKGKNVLE